MRTLPEYRVDLSRDPEDRWAFLHDCVPDIQALFDAHRLDVSGLDQDLAAALPQTAATVLPEDTIAEIEAVVRISDRPRDTVYLLNFYYDVFKMIMGCSAFGAARPGGPVHGRNLDWFSMGNVMRRFSAVFHFHTDASSAPPLYSTVGWPGFTGALSGVAPGRFAVTLNAVLSEEPARIARPISFLIREALAQAPDFATAVDLLSQTEIVADCLLLVTGVKDDEIVVIERTPGRHALRYVEPGSRHIVVTNDYKKLGKLNEPEGLDDQLAQTSCDRYDRLYALLAERTAPLDAGTALRLLSDPGVRMDSTMQQMYFQASTGLLFAPQL